MKGDFSRQTFAPEKHFGGVLMQQGRVQVDADWNELQAILLHRLTTAARDIIGQSGVPKTKPGFEIGLTADKKDLTIGAGHLYVDGILCENEAPAQLGKQPDLPAPAGAPKGRYLAYVDVWLREITALEDPSIREVALGGPDTSTRTKVVWQVKLLPVPDGASCGDIAGLPAWQALIAPPTGKLTAETAAPKTDASPCLIPSEAGYRGLHNQLYRVEVHQGGATRAASTFKWSRDNGSVSTSIEKHGGSKLTVRDLGRDELLGFSDVRWAEIVDDATELAGSPGHLVKIDKITVETREIELAGPLPALDPAKKYKLRRWDQTDGATDQGVAMKAGVIALEEGLTVSFAEGSYRTGDHWLIPARTALRSGGVVNAGTGQIEWPADPATGKAAALPPHGRRHHFAPIALVDSDGSLFSLAHDCRDVFLPLTEIEIPEDLRFHNKHLHGWGVVCGLQLHCVPADEEGVPKPREHVKLEPGYAIDPSGADIKKKEQTFFHLVEAIVAAKLAERDANTQKIPDTDVSLFLKPDGSIGLEAYKEQTTLDRLEGTLLKDFYDDCIGPLVEFFKLQLGETSDESLVNPGIKRLFALLNLFVQVIDEKASHVFLSGLPEAKYDKEDDREDKLLRELFYGLRSVLQSKTFCALYKNVEFPDYDFIDEDKVEANGRPETIFGKGFHNRLRAGPGNRVATAGLGDKVHLFDVVKRRMTQEMQFPIAGAVVQDVAFSPDGLQMYAVALHGDGRKDSAFAVATIGLDGKFTFQTPAINVCDLQLICLATHAKLPGRVVAVAKGKGLYLLNPGNFDPTPEPSGEPFYAVGHLTLLEQGGKVFAYVGAANESSSGTNEYNQVRRYQLDPTAATLSAIFAIESGVDAILPVLDPKHKLFVLLSVANPTGFNRRLNIIDLTAAPLTGGAPSAAPFPWTTVDLLRDTGVRLAYAPGTGRLFVTYEDAYEARVIDLPHQEFNQERHPLQIGPVSAAVASNGERIAVLNFSSNTITTLPAKPPSLVRRPELAKYRVAAINAFLSLAGRFLQYVKDCFCEHFLVDCPTGEGKIYLGSVSIKDGEVYQICNFDRRKYVHTFPTVEYWLSVVPVLPFVKQALETICCCVMPPLFDKLQIEPPQREEETRFGLFRPSTARYGAEHVYALNPRVAVNARLNQLVGLGGLGAMLLENGLGKSPVIDPEPKASTSTLVGKSRAEAEKVASTNRWTIRSFKSVEEKAAGGLVRAAFAPKAIAHGAAVEVFTDRQGVVRYVLPVDGETVETERLAAGAGAAESGRLTALEHENAQQRDQISNLKSDLAALREEFAKLAAEVHKKAPSPRGA
jgi:uncharacterized protein DUF6519